MKLVLADRDRLRAPGQRADLHGGGACSPKRRRLQARGRQADRSHGNVENMYMHRQVRANHLKHGEEMLRGTMTSAAALTGGSIRHLEVQICKRATRGVVTNANPKIVVDDTAKRTILTLPVSVMEGIGEGAADLHYGNNVAMARTHRFIVTVTWSGQRVSVRFVLR
jgi:hypothetical protein